MAFGAVPCQSGHMVIERSDVNTVFGKVLKGIVKENDKTQQGVADYLGQNVVTINRIFGGKREITVKQFFQIADYCGVDPAEILNRVSVKLRSMSPVADNVVPLKRVSEMTDAEVEAIRKRAATNDPELEQDEPEST